jgi:predicted peptidase
MQQLTLICLTIATIFIQGCAVHESWTLAEGQHPQTLERAANGNLKTRIQLFLPAGYNQVKGSKWPLIVFLHGSGERGADIDLVKLHGPPKIVADKKDFPFIVVSPQAPEGAVWDSTTINALLDEVLERLPVDIDRIYLTGLSLGGHGTWNIAADRPERFAAIAPVCGAGNIVNACKLKNVPVWAFHGDQDSVVSLESDAKMVKAVQDCGGNVKFTVYPGVGHDSWTQTYANPSLYEWFLQHRRKTEQP